MPILDAALAFALTMLLISTAVSAIVTLVQNVVKLRRSEMEKMLTAYYQFELQPVIKREMVRLKVLADSATAQHLEQLACDTNTRLLFGVDADNLVSASTAEILERLRRSPLGTELMTQFGKQAEKVFDELGKRYEAIGEKFTLSFRGKSQVLATVVALILAVVLNIDSIFLVDSYIKNQGLRDAVLAQRDTIQQNYNDLVGSFKDPNATVTKADVEKAFSQSQAQITGLTDIGLPIGWTYFPYAGFKDQTSNEFMNRNSLQGWAFWILGILATAGLAGLGSPFWYDLVAGASRVVESARKKQTQA